MSVARDPAPVLYVLAVLYRDVKAWEGVRGAVEESVGALTTRTEPRPFTCSDYYEKEMGGPLVREYHAAEAPQSPANLPAIKLEMNRIEQESAEGGRRIVNLDPGYVDDGHLILATCKPQPGRPYLDRGVYAYLALIYRNGTFSRLPWTYPDYREPSTIRFFNEQRKRYLDLGCKTQH